VAQGFSQVESIDYDETFSHVLCITSLRVMFAIATHLNLEIHQLDVETAFLNGYLKDKIYMDQPKGYVIFSNQVCKLLRTIYGLKQSPWAWFDHVNSFFLQLGFPKFEANSNVYVKTIDQNLLYIGLYVDDCIIMRNNLHLLNTTKQSKFI